ncbi:protein translocase subunit SecD [Patescibacteria group bacterium]|nr:protein translocase subunit SecD [Patescibacteria group bacterium]MBU1889921.1 protein translocase subunit SecD [Patescibacteria group bacterium]
MTTRNKVWIAFIFIIILAGLAGIVDYPKGPDLKIGDWTKELKVRLGLDLQGGTHLVYEADVASIPVADRTSSLEGVRDVIERRVNAFGISEPVVQTSKVGDSWRVIVELAGVFDINEAIQQIGETPLLEFREQAEPEPYTDEQLSAIRALNEESKNKANAVLEEALLPEADFTALANQYSEDPSNVSNQNGGDLNFFFIGQMVPEFEEVVFNQMQVGETYPELVETQFGYHIIRKTDERTTGEGEEAVVEARASHILFRKQSEEPTAAPEFVNTDLSGKQLERAEVQFDPNTGSPQVALKFDSEGKDLFAEITKRNLGQVVGIYLDGSPISQPVVQNEITSGEAVITGSFTLQESKTLAQRLNSGALPVPVELINQQNIGASLGKVSVERSLLAGLIGLAFVALFMVVYYRLPGLLAVIALVIYSMIVLAIFKLWSVTLTLAGVAGFILSIGMAVDANVLIFERIKEELKLGKPLGSAIEEGFKRAWLSIRDSNISSLITCFILMWFGSSLIKGFAVTLSLGIVVSMFSAITITRTFLRLIASDWLARHKGLLGVKK